MLDADREEVFRARRSRLRWRSVTLRVGQGDPAAAVRQRGHDRPDYVRGQEAKTFAALARFVADDADRAAAIRALQRIAARRLAEGTGAAAARCRRRRISPSCRPSSAPAPEALDAMEFADALAALLPADEAKTARAELSELGVRVIRIGTLFERMSLRQGHDRGAGRQAGRVRVRELRPDAAQLRDRPAGLAGGDRPGGRSHAPSSRRRGRAALTCRSRTRCCWPARCCSRGPARS